MKRLSRRHFLGMIAGGAALAGCQPEAVPRRAVPGRIVNSGPPQGHLLRRADSWSEYKLVEDSCDIAVVGAGVAGLTAAWKLRRAGVPQIRLFDLEDELGGTSRSGNNAGQPFPWGAHYINIPPPEADCIHEVLRDLGVIEGYDGEGWPMVAADSMLRWPHERLFVDGAWTDGLNALPGASSKQREELRRFDDEMLGWSIGHGRDGRRAFAMPLRYSSADSKIRALDAISMADYLDELGLRDPHLRWLVDYACRDDYGSRAHQVSAWAGIHYYACRFYDYRVQERYPSHTLTWAEGNGYLAAGLASVLEPGEIKSRSLVSRLSEGREVVDIGYIDLISGQKKKLKARAVVYAGKLHTAPYVIPALPTEQKKAMSAIEYSPWLVAAIFLHRRLEGPSATWDNISYASPSTGYVVADHQRDATGRVLVYYWPFTDDLKRAREELLARDHAFWTDQIMADLRQAHPDIDDAVERIDLYRWGHGMMRPVPGALWSRGAESRQRPMDRIFFSSCDTTGLPLYEEAVFSGIHAAEQAMGRLGFSHTTSLGGLHDG